MTKTIEALPELVSISRQVWIDYDEEADVLYISFRKPQRATDSVLEENIIYHYDGESLVGMTVIGFRATQQSC
ncbi:MAG: DUF2283 domain-containing protein [Chloroflexota bacterium]|nr:DUF2283 domain-containing protein [Chloroflexota bacterium]